MKVLVTGGGGFLGRYIVQELQERGWDAVVLGRSPRPDLESAGVRVVCGDVADPAAVREACRGADAVIHSAAKVEVWGNDKSFYRTNVIGTRHIIGACLEAGIKRLVFTSTPGVVFTGKAIENGDESLPYGGNWLCEYIRTKALAEMEVLDAHHPDSLRTAALRPHLLFGPGDPNLLPRIIALARRKRLKIIGDGDNLLDLTYVKNAASAHILALDALDDGIAGGKAYFITQGRPVRIWDWINDILRRLDIPQIAKKISLEDAYKSGEAWEKIWAFLRLKSPPPMTRFVAVEMARSHYFNISAARRDLGYEPAVATETGVEIYVNHLKNSCRARILPVNSHNITALV